MFPLHDNNPRHGRPYVTVLLIAANALAFFYQLSLGPGGVDELFHTFGMVPARLGGEVVLWRDGQPIGGAWFTPFTSMFLHAGWMHIIGNMWMLWLFGDNVEDRFGHLRYLLFYLLCGLGAAAAHYFTEPASVIPTVGASGAIAGVMGAYLLLYPRARIVTLVVLVVFVQMVEIPALVFLGLWILTQVWSGTMTFGDAQAGGVAFWAHVGGFAAGVLLLPLMLLGRPVPPSALWRRRA